MSKVCLSETSLQKASQKMWTTDFSHTKYCHTCQILSLAENLTSSSLQDGATNWYYFLTWTTPHPPTAKLCLSMLCGVPTPIVPPINKVCAVSPLPFFYVVWCPHPMCYPRQQSMCSVPPSSIRFFCAVSPHPNVVFFHSGSVLDSKQN